MMETASGLLGYEHAELACIPCGSANDFLRSYEGADFLDLDAMVNGDVQQVDGINCGGRLSLNICSMGMDADVAWRMSRFKKLPLVSGSMAYNLAIMNVLFHRLGKDLRVEMDTVNGKVECKGRYFFALAANGQYYGGGYRGAPQARMDDGLLDFILVDSVGRVQALQFLKKYKAGQHLNLDICHVYRGTRMQVIADTPAAVNVDGECFLSNSISFDILPNAIRFVTPHVGIDTREDGTFSKETLHK
jgi:diacylglycerol kinase family enzyme